MGDSADPFTRWQEIIAALDEQARACAEEAAAAGNAAVRLPLELDRVPAMMQFFLSTGQLSREHVAYQSMDRLLLGAAGLSDHGEGQHGNLQSFCETMKSVGGKAALHLLHGQGDADDPHTVGAGDSHAAAHMTPFEYFAKHNFGAFSVSTVKRHMPPHPVADDDVTVVLPDVLNLFGAAKQLGLAVSWAPAGDVRKRNIPLVLTIDGMLLRIGADHEQASGNVWGFSSRVGLAEVKAYNAMTEPEQAQWRKANPLVQEAVEVLGIVADGTVVGHTGFYFDSKGGDATTVGRRISKFVRRVGHVCEACMLWGFNHEKSWTEIMARCDLHCPECDGCDEQGGCGLHGEHYTWRACTMCVSAGRECVQFHVLMVVMDSGGEQGGFIRRATRREPMEGVRLYDTEVMSDTPHDFKAAVRAMCNHSLRVSGQLVGVHQLWARYFDSNATSRLAMRCAITRVQLRGKNAFSVLENKAKVERSAERAMASPAELASGESLVVSTRCPERFRQWNSNTAAMFKKPMGLAYHAKSGLLFGADPQLRRINVIKFSHNPCEVAVIAKGEGRSSRQLASPTGVALLGTDLYVTDPGLSPPGVWRLVVSSVLRRFSGATELAAEAANDLAREGDLSEGGGASKRAKKDKKLSLLQLDGGVVSAPFGIAAGPQGSSTLYMTDRGTHSVLQLTVIGGQRANVISLWDAVPAPPTGIALVSAKTVVVAAGDTVWLVTTAVASTRNQPAPLLRIGGSCLIGVALSPTDHALYAIDSAANAVLRLKEWHHKACATRTEVLVGGNPERPEGHVWGEGTASDVRLWGPTFCTFASNSFVFSNSAEGPFGKILQLSDVTPLVTRVMPSLRLLADACCMTDTVADHAHTWDDMLSYLKRVRDFLDGVESANLESWDVPRGAEGPGGNFSNSLRLNLRSNSVALQRSLDHQAALGVPALLIAHFSPRALATTPNENFNGRQRRHSPMPTSLEWLILRTEQILEESKYILGVAFSYWTGNMRRRQHYIESGLVKASVVYRQRKLPQPVALTEEELREVREFAREEFGGSKTQRVTDKAKERVGVQPAVFYGPKPIEPIPNSAAQAMLSSLLETTFTRGSQCSSGSGSSSSGTTSRVLLHARALVFIKPDNKPGEVWIAELVEALVALIEPAQGAGGSRGKGKAAVPKPKAATTIRMSSESLAIRYFNPSQESPEDGGVRFTFAYDYKLASYEAIWGTVDSCHTRCIEGSELMSFTLDDVEYERGLALVSSQHDAAPPIALQFEELLNELRSWDDDESSAGPSSAESSDSEEATAGPSSKPIVTQTTRGGRTVLKPIYKE